MELPSQPFHPRIFPACFTTKPISPPRHKTTTMAFSESVKREISKETHIPRSHNQQNQPYQTEANLGQKTGLNKSPGSPPHKMSPWRPKDNGESTSGQGRLPHQSPPFSTPLKMTYLGPIRERDTPIADFTTRQPLPASFMAETNHLKLSNLHTKPTLPPLHHASQTLNSQKNAIQHTHESDLLPSSCSFPPRNYSSSKKLPHIHELTNIWSKISPPPSKQNRLPSPDHFRPHAELLLHLRRSSSLSAISLPPFVSPDRNTRQSLPHAHTIPSPPSPSSPTSPSPQAHLSHRPRRANDYTGEFKREFCALLAQHAEARSQWEHFWRKRECTGRRPCIKSYLAFCELFPEFAKLRRIHKYRVLGTRTNCECSFQAHQQPLSSRFAPY